MSLFAFLNASMSSSVQRFYNYKKGAEGSVGMRQVFNTSLYIQALIAIVTLVMLESFGLWYINFQMVIPVNRLLAANWLFQFSVLNLVLVIMQIPFAGAIIANERMDYFALVGILDVLLKLGIVLALPYINSDKLIFYGSFILLTGLLNFLMYAIYAKVKFGFIQLRRTFNKSLFKQMLSFTGWTVLDSVAYMLKGQGVNVLLNAFCGPVVNAARGVAYQLSNALSGFQSNVIVAFKPQMIQSFAEEKVERVKSLMYSSSKISFVLLATFSIPIIFEIDYILNLWLKGAVPENTIPFTIIVLVNMVISSLNTPLSVTVMAVGKLKNYQLYRNIITLCVLPFSWIALRMGAGPLSVFIISLIISLIVHPVSMVLLHNIFSYSYKTYCTQVLLPCLSFSIIVPIMPCLIKYMMTESFIRLLLVAAVSVFVSFITAMICVFDRNERTIIYSWMSTMVKKIKR